MNPPAKKLTPIGQSLILVTLVLSACPGAAPLQRAPCPSQTEQSNGTSNETSATEESSGDTALALQRINLNHMTRDELLDTIPGFGSRMVREFFEYQPYVSIQQFRRETGMYVDNEQVAFFEQFIYVPVCANDSDAETLKQIPGVDDAIAELLMAARPFASDDALLAALSEHLDQERLEIARLYLNQWCHECGDPGQPIPNLPAADCRPVLRSLCL